MGARLTSDKFADGAIDSEAIGDGSVTTEKLADGKAEMTSTPPKKIADGTITTIDLADGAVDSAKILDRHHQTHDRPRQRRRGTSSRSWGTWP